MDEGTQTLIPPSESASVLLYSKCTDVHNERAQGYRSVHKADLEDYTPPPRANHKTPKPKGPRSTPPAVRAEILMILQDAVKQAEMMKQAAQDNLPRDLASASMDLFALLRRLWGFRTHCSDDWATIVSFLQGSFATQSHALSPACCESILEVLRKHLHLTADREDVAEGLELLRSAGLDPLRAIEGLGE